MLPWPNGYGATLRRWRLRVRVPQGVGYTFEMCELVGRLVVECKEEKCMVSYALLQYKYLFLRTLTPLAFINNPHQNWLLWTMPMPGYYTNQQPLN